MDKNESKPEVVTEEKNESAEVVETKETETTEAPESEKPSRTPEEELAYFEGRAKRLRKELGVESEKKADKKLTKKSDEIDYGQLALYNTKSDSVKIESDDDIEFLRQTIEDTGKDQKTILSAKWFQSELKEKKEVRTVEKATPSPSRLPGENTKSKVDYWINKGELPPDPALRIDVVNKKIELAKAGRKF